MSFRNINFFPNATATAEIYTLSLHDALPILTSKEAKMGKVMRHTLGPLLEDKLCLIFKLAPRSEERFSRNAETDLVCRLLLEKKNLRHSPPSSVLLVRWEAPWLPAGVVRQYP